MGFAAGFAAGYEAVDKGRREEEARQKALQDAADKVTEAKKKDMLTATSNTESYDKQALEYENKILNSKDEIEYNANVASLKSLMDNRVKLLNAAEKAGFSTDALDIMKQGYSKQYEPIVKTEIPTYDGGKQEVYLPQSLASQSNNLNLSETGTIGKAILGSDNKIVGYQPTEVQPIKFKDKEEYGKGLVDVTDSSGKHIKVSNTEYMNNQNKYSIYEKPDKGTNVSVKIDQQVNANEKLYDELYNLNENGNIDNKKDLHRMKAVSGQLLSNATTEDKKAVGETKQLIGTIPALERIANIQDKLASDLKNKGGDTVVSKAITNIAPYIGSNNKLMELAGMDENTIATTLKLDTSVAKVIGDYAKAMSGLSLTDSQLQYYKNTVVGGDWMDYKTRALKTNQFIADEKKNIESKLNTYGDLMLDEKKKWESKYGSKQDNSNIKQAPYGNEVTRNGKNYIWDSSINKYVLKP